MVVINMANPPKVDQTQAEFGSWGADFDRLTALLKTADELAVYVRLFDTSKIHPYFSVLKQIHINLRPLITEEDNKNLDRKFSIILKEIHEAASISQATGRIVPPKMKLCTDLEEIDILLIGLKQAAGLGVPVRKESSELDRLDSVVGV
jgi:hypothetical protein